MTVADSLVTVANQSMCDNILAEAPFLDCQPQYPLQTGMAHKASAMQLCTSASESGDRYTVFCMQGCFHVITLGQCFVPILASSWFGPTVWLCEFSLTCNLLCDIVNTAGFRRRAECQQCWTPQHCWTPQTPGYILLVQESYGPPCVQVWHLL